MLPLLRAPLLEAQEPACSSRRPHNRCSLVQLPAQVQREPQPHALTLAAALVVAAASNCPAAPLPPTLQLSHWLFYTCESQVSLGALTPASSFD